MRPTRWLPALVALLLLLVAWFASFGDDEPTPPVRESHPDVERPGERRGRVPRRPVTATAEATTGARTAAGAEALRDADADLTVHVRRTDGAVVSAAVVELRAFDGESLLVRPAEPARREMTDETGAALFSPIAGRTWWVGARDGGEASQWQSVEVRPAEATDVTLEIAPARTIRGSVFDPEFRPAEGAILHLDFQDGDGGWYRVFGEAEARGAFLLDRVPVRLLHRLDLTVDAPPHPRTWLTFTRDELENFPVLIVQMNATTIEGRCIDPTGRPAADAWLVLRPGQKPVAQTDADGTFRFRAALRDETSLLIKSSKFAVTRADLPAPDDDGTIRIGDVTLHPGRPLRGIVWNKEGGLPVGMARVELHTADRRALAAAVTGLDGRFVFAHVGPAEHTLVVQRHPLHVGVRLRQRIRAVFARDEDYRIVLPPSDWLLLAVSGPEPLQELRYRVTSGKAPNALHKGRYHRPGDEVRVEVPGPGFYAVEVGAPGHETEVRHGVQVRAGKATVVRVTLRRSPR